MTILAYGLALLSGFVAKFIYGIIYGFLYSLFPTSIIMKLLPKFISEHHNKLYLHVLWISSEFLSTLIACIIISRFGITINWIFIFLLCLSPVLILSSKSMRKPENYGYFNLILQMEDPTKDIIRQIAFINKMEGISRIVGVFLCLYII